MPVIDEVLSRFGEEFVDLARLFGNRRDAVLGAARVGPDPNEEGLAILRHALPRSAGCARRLTR
jgi:hypothetical protein